MHGCWRWRQTTDIQSAGRFHTLIQVQESWRKRLAVFQSPLLARTKANPKRPWPVFGEGTRPFPTNRELPSLVLALSLVDSSDL